MTGPGLTAAVKQLDVSCHLKKKNTHPEPRLRGQMALYYADTFGPDCEALDDGIKKLLEIGAQYSRQ
jgi:hypothetical protein